MGMDRRLSAILAADMVGFSRLMEADEVGTLRRQKVHRAELIDPSLEEYHGRIVKEMGDGVLVEFPSVVEAVQCAVIIQRGMSDRETNISDDRRIQYRIGINLGDIIIDDNDIFGDGVNIAARLEQMAEPGCICISGTAYDHLKSKVEVGYEALGEVQVKNIQQSVRAYKVLTDPNQVGIVLEDEQSRLTISYRLVAISAALMVAVITAGGWWWLHQPDSNSNAVVNVTKNESNINPIRLTINALQIHERPSIAVLPFDNFSTDPQQEFFSDGITEDLITDLSQVSGLFVIARNTVFTYKGEPQEIQRIGKKLGVKYILEGSVRKSGDNLRINVQLIDVQTGGHIWAQRFDRKLADVFELQDEVVQKIVAALAVTLSPVEKERLERVNKVHPEAYIAFLRGQELMRRGSKETHIEAVQFFEKSIEIDPNFARVYANLAFTHSTNADYLWSDDPAKSTMLAFKFAQQALILDSSVPQTYFALTLVYRLMGRLDDGILAARKAISLDPNYADAYAILAVNLNYDGQYTRALDSIDYAMRLNPEAPFDYRWIKGDTHYLLGQLEEAAGWLEGVRDSNPAFSNVYQLLIATYVELERIDDAEWAANELLTLVPNFSLSQEEERVGYKDKEVKRRYIESLRRAGIE
jgi:adenylate cyclase